MHSCARGWPRVPTPASRWWCSRSEVRRPGRGRRRAQRRAGGGPADLPQPDRGGRRRLGARRARAARAGQDAGRAAARSGAARAGDRDLLGRRLRAGRRRGLRAGLGLPAFSEQTAARLAELLPSAATVANPLDYTAMIWGDARALGELVTAVGSDPSIGQVLVFYDTPAGMAGAVDESWAARPRRDHRRRRGQSRRRRWLRLRCPSCSTTKARGGSPRPGSRPPPDCAPGSRVRRRCGCRRATPPGCVRSGRWPGGSPPGRDGMAQRARVKAAAARRRHRRGRRADRDRRRRRGGGARLSSAARSR